MKPQDIRDLLHATPFKPFRVHLVDGKELNVPHQDFVLVTMNYVVIANELPGGRPGNVNLVPYEHVSRMEMLSSRPRKAA